ncbi:MAG: N-acetyltransferase [Clostridia bacterium]|nr:N-acetyltransferase [Clostridia bacterium]
MLQIRKGILDDLEKIMEIYKSAQDFMILSGNPNQWGHFNPTEEMIISDIRIGNSRVIFDEVGIHGVFAQIDTGEPTYDCIVGGKWLNDDPYITIHRVAGDGKVHGIFKCAADHCKSLSSNVRIDTHAENLVMQRHIEANGFVKCGTIYLANGSPRIAYHWTLSNN